jgi:hypothetical protein
MSTEEKTIGRFHPPVPPQGPLQIAEVRLAPDYRSADVRVVAMTPDLENHREMLQSKAASDLAVQAAIANGMPTTACFSGYTRPPYAANVYGEIVGTVKDAEGKTLPLTDKRNRVHHYEAVVLIR